MPNTALGIVNRALQLLGAPAISALENTSDPNAVYMNALYETTVAEKLQEGEWNWANVRASLAGLGMTCTPAWGFDCRYGLPCTPYCVQVLEVSLDGDENVDQTEAWRIETLVEGSTCTRTLVTDSTAVSVLYVGLVGAEVWSSMFAEAMTFELAYKACYAITRNATLLGELETKAERKWAKARVRDGQEGRKKNNVLTTVLTRIR